MYLHNATSTVDLNLLTHIVLEYLHARGAMRVGMLYASWECCFLLLWHFDVITPICAFQGEIQADTAKLGKQW